MPTSRDSSKARTRPSHSRNSSRQSASYLPHAPESLVLPDGVIEGDTVHLMQEFIHPHSHDHEETIVEEVEAGDQVSDEELEIRRRSPWWRRPSELWFLAMIPFIMAANTTTIAPRIEIVTELVCYTLRPEYRAGADPSLFKVNSPLTKLCASDPVVQAAAAKFLIVMNTSTGILSCLTTAWWGSRSDRKGRISTMRICLLGLLATDATYIIVSRFFSQLSGAYWLLLLGPLFEGSLGGMSAASANIHAYIADCTEPAKRSRTFSLYLGLLFSGVAFGPALGSLVIRYTQEAVSAFYFAAATHIIYVFVVWFIVPESLFPSQLARSKVLYTSQSTTDHWLHPRRLFRFLAPLQLFFPRKPTENHTPKARSDWNLTFLAMAYGFNIMLLGSFPYIFQYATLQFGWTSEILGYWMSVIGVTRAAFLTLLLPAIISLFKPRTRARVAQANPDTETDQLLSPREQSPSAGHDRHHNTPAFDLNIARTSLVVELVSYTMIAAAPTGSMFTLGAAMGSFGTGFTPALQSLALTLYTSAGGVESGSLFGALSVVQALGANLTSPSLFGLTYAATVGTFPQAIFVVCAVAAFCSLVLISFVRLPKAQADAENYEEDDGTDEHLLGETLVEPLDRRLPKIILTDDVAE